MLVKTEAVACILEHPHLDLKYKQLTYNKGAGSMSAWSGTRKLKAFSIVLGILGRHHTHSHTHFDPYITLYTKAVQGF